MNTSTFQLEIFVGPFSIHLVPVDAFDAPGADVQAVLGVVAQVDVFGLTGGVEGFLGLLFVPTHGCPFLQLGLDVDVAAVP